MGGKTSLLRMMAGLTAPLAGTALWKECPIQQLGEEYRRELLYCGHLLGLKGEFKCHRELSRWGSTGR